MKRCKQNKQNYKNRKKVNRKDGESENDRKRKRFKGIEKQGVDCKQYGAAATYVISFRIKKLNYTCHLKG